MLLSACLFYCLMAASVAFSFSHALGTRMEQCCPSEGLRSFLAQASRISQTAGKTAGGKSLLGMSGHQKQGAKSIVMITGSGTLPSPGRVL